MSRYIDADAMKEWIDEYVSVFKKSDNKDIKGYIEHQPTIEAVPKEFHDKTCEAMAKRHQEEIADILERADADRPQGEWVDCKEPPSTDRNVFIAYGTDDMKSVCIGHYEHGMKMWYEDKNFFAKPLYGGMYWCEIPQFPTRMKGADDE